MGERTEISWCDSTFNPWWGCTKVSPACDHCYAEAWAKRSGEADLWQGRRRRTSAANWNKVLRWNKVGWWECPDCGLRGDVKTMGDEPAGIVVGDRMDERCRHTNAKPARLRVFCASMADVFDNEVPQAWRDDLWALIASTPNLDWLLLTKRIGNWRTMAPTVFLPNIWLGATVVNQEEADRDVPKLIEARAAVRFLSIEPMLGRVDLCAQLGMWWNQTMNCWEGSGREINRDAWGKRRIDWVIAGGESGGGARPMNPEWVRSLVRQCQGAGVAFHFKQWGEWGPVNGDAQLRGDTPMLLDMESRDGGFARYGKKAAGRMLDGRTHDGFPV